MHRWSYVVRDAWTGITSAIATACVQQLSCCNLLTFKHPYQMFEELYDYYARGSSYFVTPGAAESLRRIRAAGALTVLW